MEITPNPNAARDAEEKKKKTLTSRRAFLKGVASTVAATGAIVLTEQATFIYRKREAVLRALTGRERETTEAIENAKKFLKDTYDVTVELGDELRHRDTFAEELTKAESIQSLQFLIEEMGKYPADFFARNKLTFIRIAKNFQYGHAFGPSALGGFAVREKRTIGLGFSWDHLEQFRDAFHHELHHVLDFWNGGDAANDARWEQIHQGCTCTPEVRRKPFEQGLDRREIGDRSFINIYGESSALEERAEFAAMMMVPRQHAAFLKRVARESEEDRSILERKYQGMVRDFFDWSGEKMDQAYWDAIIELGAEETDHVDGGSGTSEDWYSDYQGSDVFEFEKLKR